MPIKKSEFESAKRRAEKARHGVVHFEIPTADPKKLANFYAQLFGWEITETSTAGEDYWNLTTGPVDENGVPKEAGYIGVGLTKRRSSSQGPTNYVEVESVDYYLHRSKLLGAEEIIAKTPMLSVGWFAVIGDPDGNQFGIWQRDASAK
jgi:predicted enzyme related to lactoylglutathione lyase